MIKKIRKWNKKWLLLIIFPGMAMCSQTGWKGYYNTYPSKGANKYIAKSVVNATPIKLPNQEEFWLELPRDCSGITFAGILTPFTPPIIIPNFRAISFGETNPCNNFIVLSKPKTKIQLHTNNKIYHPKESKGPFGNTRYTFPVKAKNIDSGTIIIEKDGEKAEVPFKYEYFKFYF